MAFHQGGTQRLWPARDTAQCPFETTLDLQTQDVLHGTTTVMSRGAARARVSRGAKNCGTFLRRVLLANVMKSLFRRRGFARYRARALGFLRVSVFGVIPETAETDWPHVTSLFVG